MLHSLLRLGSHYRDLNHTAFRKTATRLTAAAMMLGGLAVSAKADDAASTFAAACASIKNGADRAGCMIDQVGKHTKDMKRVEDQAKAAAPCIQFLLEKVAAKLTTPDQLKKIAGGDITNANACSVADTFGRRADLKSPPGSSAGKPSAVAFTR